MVQRGRNQLTLFPFLRLYMCVLLCVCVCVFVCVYVCVCVCLCVCVRLFTRVRLDQIRTTWSVYLLLSRALGTLALLLLHHSVKLGLILANSDQRD